LCLQPIAYGGASEFIISIAIVMVVKIIAGTVITCHQELLHRPLLRTGFLKTGGSPL